MQTTLKEKAINRNLKFIVSLDGPSASGKGHIGSMLADRFGLKYVQSSIVYRGLAYILMQDSIPVEDVDSIINLSANTDIISRVDGIDLNTEEIGEIASKISVISEVRKNLSIYLQKMIKTTNRIIMEGRDIGTIIAPNADLKIFITADVEVRARRRFKQLHNEGKDCMLGDVLDLLKTRDERDESRSAAPLKAASDALVIDTTNLTPTQVMQTIEDYINKRSANTS